MLPLLLALALATPVDPVNAIAGDRSWIEAHGRAPDASTPEVARITTHLLWIEARLRDRDTRALAPSQREARAHLLDVLHAYALAGVFPHHSAPVGGRRPRFVDDEGRHCAVAALVRESAGPALVESIRVAHELDYLGDMHEPALAAWASDHGFTSRELAEIQPTYDDDGSITMPDERFERFVRRADAWRQIQPAPFTQADLDRVVSELDPIALARSCLAGRRGSWSVQADTQIAADLTPRIDVVASPMDGGERDARVERCVARAITWFVRRAVMRRRYQPGQPTHATYAARLEGRFHR